MQNLPLYVAAVAFTLAFALKANATDKSHCREYTQTLNIGNDVQEAYGTACLQPDGTWRIIKAATVKEHTAEPVTKVYIDPEPAYRSRYYRSSYPWYRKRHAWNKNRYKSGYSTTYRDESSITISFGNNDRHRYKNKRRDKRRYSHWH